MTIYYDTIAYVSQRSENPNSPDHGFRAEYTTERPPVIFHACCCKCTVQLDDRMGIEMCRQCKMGPMVAPGENKFDLESYSRPETSYEYDKKMRLLASVAEQSSQAKIKKYTDYKQTIMIKNDSFNNLKKN